MRAILAIAMLAAAVTAAQAQQQNQVSPLSYTGRLAICDAQWSQAARDPKVAAAGRAAYLRSCNARLCRSTPGARCRASTLAAAD